MKTTSKEKQEENCPDATVQQQQQQQQEMMLGTRLPFSSSRPHLLDDVATEKITELGPFDVILGRGTFVLTLRDDRRFPFVEFVGFAHHISSLWWWPRVRRSAMLLY